MSHRKTINRMHGAYSFHLYIYLTMLAVTICLLVTKRKTKHWNSFFICCSY